tara:strand:+ start:2178 stop:2897 length:720 start_codon:yes stop_codon:yes gene_type:complete
MDMKQIVLYAVILIIIYLVWNYIFSDPTSKNLITMIDGQKTKRIKYGDLPGNKGSNDFAYSFWIYINDWNHAYNEKKIIIERKKGNHKGPLIYLGEHKNDLHVNITSHSALGGQGSPPPNEEIITLENIPVQKFTHIVVTVNNSAVDMYLDGKLVKTHILNNVSTVDEVAEADIVVNKGNGFSGYLAKLKYVSRTLNPREVYEIYKEGYGAGLFGGLINRYKLKFAFLKDNNEITSMQI